MIKLVVAVGNPGTEYEFTRHNIAWIFLDHFPALSNANWQSKFKGDYAQVNVEGEKRYFIKPQTYMNLSGECVAPFCHFFKITAEQVLVVHDEVDLNFGHLQFKKGGGFAGHNGLKSIAQHLGTSEFYRLRVGIGRPKVGSMSSWVLGRFPKDSEIELELVLGKCSEALNVLFKSGFSKASNQFNKKNFLDLH